MLISTKFADFPELLFRQCREALDQSYSASSTIAGSSAGGADGELSADPSLPLDKLERRVAETCAKDLARMQIMPTMYKKYREFVLVHGGENRDVPQNLRKDEVSFAFSNTITRIRE